MSDFVAALVVTSALVLAGCAPSTTTGGVPPSEATERAPAVDPPGGFASPRDLLHRYPTMRRQQL
jgi:hypothetical protein